MRSLIYMVVWALLFLGNPATAQESAPEQTGPNLPNGYVALISLFDFGHPTLLGVAYDLGVIIDDHAILSNRRSVLAHGGGQTVMAYRIIILTADLSVLSGLTYDYSPDSQSAIIHTTDVLQLEPTPPEIIYNYQPQPEDEFEAIILVSEGDEPLRITHLTLEPLAVHQTPVELKDELGLSLPTGDYYQLQIIPESDVPTLPQEIIIHSGFVLKDGRIVGLLLERNDGVLFLVPIISPVPQSGAGFYIRK